MVIPEISGPCKVLKLLEPFYLFREVKGNLLIHQLSFQDLKYYS